MHSQNVATFATQGFLAPLDTYARRDRGALDGLLPAAVASYRFKNALCGVPDVATSLVMFVNRTLFTKAGLPLPAEKWTWTDFLSAAQKVQNANRTEGAFGVVDYTGGFPRLTV